VKLAEVELDGIPLKTPAELSVAHAGREPDAMEKA
jgi:hypothetical protein